jgi:hypothetical protein
MARGHPTNSQQGSVPEHHSGCALMASLSDRTARLRTHPMGQHLCHLNNNRPPDCCDSIKCQELRPTCVLCLKALHSQTTATGGVVLSVAILPSQAQPSHCRLTGTGATCHCCAAGPLDPQTSQPPPAQQGVPGGGSAWEVPPPVPASLPNRLHVLAAPAAALQVPPPVVARV